MSGKIKNKKDLQWIAERIMKDPKFMGGILEHLGFVRMLGENGPQYAIDIEKAKMLSERPELEKKLLIKLNKKSGIPGLIKKKQGDLLFREPKCSGKDMQDNISHYLLRKDLRVFELDHFLYAIENINYSAGIRKDKPAPPSPGVFSYDEYIDFLGRRIPEWKNAKGMKTHDSLVNALNNAADLPQVFILTTENLLDMKRFMESAYYAATYGKKAAKKGGYVLEVQQRKAGGQSGFSMEDLFSDNEGAKFGDDLYLDEALIEQLKRYLTKRFEFVEPRNFCKYALLYFSLEEFMKLP